MPLDSLSIEELLILCRQGDDDAMAFFYSRYQPLIMRTVRRKFASVSKDTSWHAEVKDVCQEIFSRLYSDDCRVLSGLHKPRSIDAWLMTIAQNHVVSYLRKSSRYVDNQPVGVREQAAPYGRTPADDAIKREEVELLRKGLAKLSDKERFMIELYYVQGLKYAEIAEMTGLNINTVSVSLHRGKMKLQRIMKGIMNDSEIG